MGLIELLYLENPELIFKENREGKIPFELLFSAFPEFEDSYDKKYSKYWVENEADVNRLQDSSRNGRDFKYHKNGLGTVNRPPHGELQPENLQESDIDKVHEQ